MADSWQGRASAFSRDGIIIELRLPDLTSSRAGDGYHASAVQSDEPNSSLLLRALSNNAVQTRSPHRVRIFGCKLGLETRMKTWAVRHVRRRDYALRRSAERLSAH
jgi:hypothetical protein